EPSGLIGITDRPSATYLLAIVSVSDAALHDDAPEPASSSCLGGSRPSNIRESGIWGRRFLWSEAAAQFHSPLSCRPVSTGSLPARACATSPRRAAARPSSLGSAALSLISRGSARNPDSASSISSALSLAKNGWPALVRQRRNIALCIFSTLAAMAS